MINVLITGGAGFIGSHLAAYHLARGDEVVAVDDLSTGSSANVAPFAANPRFRFEAADLVTWSGLAAAASRADRIYNLAAVVGMFEVLQRPVEVMRVNIIGCERVLEAMGAPRPNRCARTPISPWSPIRRCSTTR
jgi:UDP-glucose 4-epimerase